jgi:hypothetical protein
MKILKKTVDKQSKICYNKLSNERGADDAEKFLDLLGR